MLFVSTSCNGLAVPPLTTDAAPKRLGAATTFIAPRLVLPLRPGSAEWRLLGDRLVRGIPHETEVVLELIEHGAHARLGTASFSLAALLRTAAEGTRQDLPVHADKALGVGSNPAPNPSPTRTPNLAIPLTLALTPNHP